MDNLSILFLVLFCKQIYCIIKRLQIYFHLSKIAKRNAKNVDFNTNKKQHKAKGKPAEKRGRKAEGLRYSMYYDSLATKIVRSLPSYMRAGFCAFYRILQASGHRLSLCTMAKEIFYDPIFLSCHEV